MWVSTWLYHLAVAALKTTFCLQYLRIFLVGYVRPCSWTLLVFSILWGISTTFASMFFCTPIESIWNLSIPRVCIKNYAFWDISATVHILTDIMIFIIPIPTLWKLRVPK